jgi:ankyrin repeat protein
VLQTACAQGLWEIALALLPLHDVNASDTGGRRLIHEAVASGSLHLVRSLLHAGADVNAAITDGTSSLFHRGFTPLHLAVVSGFPQITALLLARGATVEAKDHPLCAAFESSRVPWEIRRDILRCVFGEAPDYPEDAHVLAAKRVLEHHPKVPKALLQAARAERGRILKRAELRYATAEGNIDELR